MAGATGGLVSSARSSSQLGTIMMQALQSSESTSSSCEDSSISSSSSPPQADYVFDMMYGDQPTNPMLSMMDLKEFYDPLQQTPALNLPEYFSQQQTQQQAQQPSSTSSEVPTTDISTMMDEPFCMMDFDDPFANSTPMDPSAFVLGDGPADTLMKDDMVLDPTTCAEAAASSSITAQKKIKHTKPDGFFNKRTASQPALTLPNDAAQPNNNSKLMPSAPNGRAMSAGDLTMMMKELDSPPFALWPNYLCLYLEYSLPYDPATTVSHNLSLLQHCYPNCLSTVELEEAQSTKQKCPALPNLVANCTNDDSIVLLAKAKLDLNLNISDFCFNNTCFFESRERRTIECTTTIYSFGNVVLESKEIQQALWINNNKYMYSFVYVNQFFDAFMKGIRSLQSWEEVDIAIRNLCIVQVDAIA